MMPRSRADPADPGPGAAGRSPTRRCRSSRRRSPACRQGQIVRQRFFRHRAAMISLVVLILIAAAGHHQHRLGPDPRLVEVGPVHGRVGRPGRRAGHAGRSSVSVARTSSSGATSRSAPAASSGIDNFAQVMRGTQQTLVVIAHPRTALHRHRCGDRRARRLLPRLGRLGPHAVHRPDHHHADHPDHRRRRLTLRRHAASRRWPSRSACCPGRRWPGWCAPSS